MLAAIGSIFRTPIRKLAREEQINVVALQLNGDNAKGYLDKCLLRGAEILQEIMP